MIIGITDTLGSEHKFQKYLEWVRGGSQNVETVTLSYAANNAGALSSCDGIVLTGGHDVDPQLYNGPLHHPKIVSVDRKRDDFEMKMLERALHQGMPILGICRGLQIANVYFGGSLIPDLEEAGYRSHRSANDSMDGSNHSVIVEPASRFSNLAGTMAGVVNTSHHQAIRELGAGLRVAARSDDGVIEAIELIDDNRPFFLCVQWHPERMPEIAAKNPFSTTIIGKFLASAAVLIS